MIRKLPLSEPGFEPRLSVPKRIRWTLMSMEVMELHHSDIFSRMDMPPNWGSVVQPFAFSNSQGCLSCTKLPSWGHSLLVGSIKASHFDPMLDKSDGCYLPQTNWDVVRSASQYAFSFFPVLLPPISFHRCWSLTNVLQTASQFLLLENPAAMTFFLLKTLCVRGYTYSKVYAFVYPHDILFLRP